MRLHAAGLRRCFAITLLVGLLLAMSCGGANETGRATRTLILIRHGAYHERDPRGPDSGMALNARGREQARLTGVRLAQLSIPIDALYSSTMTRARQTAGIIGEAIGQKPQFVTDIRECMPPTVNRELLLSESSANVDSCKHALDRAWDRFFRPSAGFDSTEVLVCHGNVIRYLVCRSIGLDPKQWLNFWLANCSLTIIEVLPDGSTRLVSFGDVGHLSPEMQAEPLTRMSAKPRPK